MGLAVILSSSWFMYVILAFVKICAIGNHTCPAGLNTFILGQQHSCCILFSELCSLAASQH
jgi:hypothetical protein